MINLRLASILGVGSIIRISGPDGAHEGEEDGVVIGLEDGRVTAKFQGWYEVWDAAALIYEPSTGVWLAHHPGDISDII